MDENEGQPIIFDEVLMQDVIAEWSKTYAEGIEVARWYYDPHRETLLVGLIRPEENQN